MLGARARRSREREIRWCTGSRAVVDRPADGQYLALNLGCSGWLWLTARAKIGSPHTELCRVRPAYLVDGATPWLASRHPRFLRPEPPFNPYRFTDTTKTYDGLVHLASLELFNFKPFKHALLELPSHGLVFIVGANNAGKSALLSALDIPLAGADGVRMQGSTEPCSAVACFELTDDDRRLVSASCAADPAVLLATPALTSVRLRYVDGPGGILTLQRVEATDPGGTLRQLGEATFSQTTQDDSVSLGNLTQSVQAGSDVAWARMETINGQNVRTSLVSSGHLAPLLNTMSNLWRARVYRFDIHRVGTQPRRQLTSAESILPNGENLPEFLVHLKTNDDPRLQAITDVLADIVPGLGRLMTPTSANQVGIDFADSKGRITNLTTLGTGVQQVLLAAAVGESASRQSVVIMEEPELHLHAGAQRKLSGHMARWADTSLLVASTHSTVFLDGNDADRNVWLVQRDEDGATLTKATTELPHVLEELGVRLGDVLGAEGVLLVEGPTDEAILTVWVGDLLRSHGITVVSARGGEAAWQTETLVRWVGEIDALPRPVLLVRDRDELPEVSIQRLEATGHVVVLDRREIENYLLDEQAIYDYLTETGVEGLTSDLVGQRIDEACDRQRNRVQLKRVAAQLAPIRALDRANVARLLESEITKDSVLADILVRVEAHDIRSRFETAWAQTEQDLAEVWATNRRALAPGADVLCDVWRSVGRSYDKRRHGAVLAARIEPPHELLAGISNRLTPSATR